MNFFYSFVRRQMARTSQSLLFGAMFVFVALANAASEIKLGNGSTLTVSNTEYSRILPHAFYDQAISSLPQLFPTHVLLASQRSEVLGEVVYALVCFKETPTSDQVVVQGVAVHGERAWNFRAISPTSSYSLGIMQVLEQIEKLPSNSGVQRPSENGRR
jgi:hypothetical protein